MHLVIPYASALSDAAVQALGTLSLPNLERLLARWAPVDDARRADLRTDCRRIRALAAPRAPARAPARLARARRPAALRRRGRARRRLRARRRQRLGPADAGALARGPRPGQPGRPGAAGARRARGAHAARHAGAAVRGSRLDLALGRPDALVREPPVAGRAAHRVDRPRHRPQRRPVAQRPSRRDAGAPPAERGADAAVRASAQRRARGARRDERQLVLAQRHRPGAAGRQGAARRRGRRRPPARAAAGRRLERLGRGLARARRRPAARAGRRRPARRPPHAGRRAPRAHLAAGAAAVVEAPAGRARRVGAHAVLEAL